jgi:hypothetical protein
MLMLAYTETAVCLLSTILKLQDQGFDSGVERVEGVNADHIVAHS